MRGFSLVVASRGHSSSRCVGLSLSRPLLLRSKGSRRAGSVVVAHGLSCSAACGILPDQGSNPCPLHWQADSQPLRHQGSPSGVSFYEDTNPTLRTSFYLNYFISGPMSKYSHTGAVGGVGLGLQHMYLEGNKNIKSVRVGTMGFLQLPSRFFLSLGFSNLNMICLGIVCLFVCLFSLLGGL